MPSLIVVLMYHLRWCQSSLWSPWRLSITKREIFREELSGCAKHYLLRIYIYISLIPFILSPPHLHRCQALWRSCHWERTLCPCRVLPSVLWTTPYAVCLCSWTSCRIFLFPMVANKTSHINPSSSWNLIEIYMQLSSNIYAYLCWSSLISAY